MSYLDVPGARLCYETRGRGPLLLMIPGATGSAGVFKLVGDHLAAHYTVLTYDRRGFARSDLDGPQDGDLRLETDAADVRRLIEYVSDEPATVFGSSSGGIVALCVLTRHPTVVRTLVPFEPPIVRLLPDGGDWLKFFAQVYDLYQQSGIEPALELFREHVFAVPDRQVMTRARDRKNGVSLRADTAYWFEHELRSYPAVDLDLNALKTRADRVVPVAGGESRGYPCYGATVELGKILGRDVIEVPGGHVGYVAQPAAFAQALHDSLTNANQPAAADLGGVDC